MYLNDCSSRDPGDALLYLEIGGSGAELGNVTAVT